MTSLERQAEAHQAQCRRCRGLRYAAKESLCGLGRYFKRMLEYAERERRRARVFPAQRSLALRSRRRGRSGARTLMLAKWVEILYFEGMPYREAIKEVKDNARRQEATWRRIRL